MISFSHVIYMMLNNIYYKTELCNSYIQNSGMCIYGLRCQFAHGPDELKFFTYNIKYKTVDCNRFHLTGFCEYGAKCHFIH